MLVSPHAVDAGVDAGVGSAAGGGAPDGGPAAGGGDAGPADAGPRQKFSRITSPPITRLRSWTAQEDLLRRARPSSDGRLFVATPDGGERLTIDRLLQQKLELVLQSYDPPYAAVVAIEPSTGRVLAMAEHSSANPAMRGLTTRAVFPAASIFKIVTATALLEAGVQPADEACFHGGYRRLSEKLLADSARDGACHSLSNAMAHSTNVVFAKMTARQLDAGTLTDVARAFRFNQPFDFPLPTDISLADIPSDPFAFAETGAGFGDVFLSPLHGAAVAAAVGEGGVWRKPVLLERDVQPADAGEQIIPAPIAEKVRAMMMETVRAGTARRVFHERGFRLPDAAGKTGSLADKKPFRDYSWFVGFAPAKAPKVAVAAIIVNDMQWRIRATWLGREAMRLYLEPTSGAITAR